MTSSPPDKPEAQAVDAAIEAAADWTQAAFAQNNPQAPLRSLIALTEQAARTLSMARALAESGRHVDISGLDQLIGRLTASTLDLDDADRPEMRLLLIGLLENLDALEQVLHEAAPMFGGNAAL